jgi:hypothetical protein
MDPQQRLLLELGYAALHGSSQRRITLMGAAGSSSSPSCGRRRSPGKDESSSSPVCGRSRSPSRCSCTRSPDGRLASGGAEQGEPCQPCRCASLPDTSSSSTMAISAFGPPAHAPLVDMGLGASGGEFLLFKRATHIHVRVRACSSETRVPQLCRMVVTPESACQGGGRSFS